MSRSSTIWIITLIGLVWVNSLGLSYSAIAAQSIALRSFKTHSRLVFKVGEDIPAELKATKQGFEILFKGITIIDLGASLGEEARWKGQYEKLKDDRLNRLTIDDEPEGVRIR